LASSPDVTAPKLFVRQSSGLVRDVTVTNALFFNAVGFIGSQVGWAPLFYSLAFVPIGVAGPFTTYGWAAIIVGIGCVFLGLIFASLATVMPRSGGDYVYTSRLIPRAGPILAWLESFTLVFASIAIVVFAVQIVLRNLQISGLIIGIGTGSEFFRRANGWFAQDGVITGLPGFLAALAVLALIVLVVVQPTRRFHRIVTGLAALGLGSWIAMFVFGLIFMDSGSFAANLPNQANGTTVADLSAAANSIGVHGSGVSFAPSTFAFVMAVVLFNYIGFQYSAYIAGEVRGNIKRGILIAVLGALVMAVLMNSVYYDALSRRVGLDGQLGWGALFWTGDKALPLGQPNSFPLVAAIAHPGLWPVWSAVSLVQTLFPFLICPVYIIFMSRIALAWSLDRQVPEWFGKVNDRLHSPLNAILTLVGIAVVLALFQNFALLPDALAPPEGKLNLAATVWFSILMALLGWLMPGVNALVAGVTRPDLVRNAPWRRTLPLYGFIWLAFGVVTYWFAGIKPISDAIGASLKPGSTESVFGYLNGTGITFALIVFAAAILIYVIQAIRNRSKGLETSLLYTEIPPD
jgi:amino acid transporter